MKPFIMNEETVSPGWTLADTTMVCLVKYALLATSVIVSKSTRFYARVLHSKRRRTNFDLSGFVSMSCKYSCKSE